MIPKVVIFDWAGTLIDPGCQAPVRAFQSAFATLGLQVSERLIRRDMGLGKRVHTERILAEPQIMRQFEAAHGRPLSSQDAEAIYRAAIEAMAELASAFSQPVPGAAATLADLRRYGVKIGSTTGYTRQVMDEIVPLAAEHGISPDVVICAEEVLNPRPGPGQILACLAALGVASTDGVVKVDDSVSGLMAGRAAGCTTVAVTGSGNPLSAGDIARWSDARCASVADLGDCLAGL